MRKQAIILKRPPWQKALASIVVTLVALWAGFYFFATDIGKAAALEPKLRKEIQAMGYFSTTEGYEKMIAVPDGQNAAKELSPLLTAFKSGSLEKSSEADFEAFIKSNIEVFNKLEVATKKPSCVMVRDRNIPPLIEFPDYVPMKNIARVLHRKAKLEHRAGRTSVAIRDWKIAARVADFSDDEHTLVGQLVRISSTGLLEKSLRDANSARAFTASEASQILAALVPLESPLDFRKAAKTEYWFATSPASYRFDIE